MNSLNTYIDQITKAVIDGQDKPAPIPLMTIEGFCFLNGVPIASEGVSIKNALDRALARSSSYSTGNSLITLVEPDPTPIIDEMGGLRYLFRHV